MVENGSGCVVKAGRRSLTVSGCLSLRSPLLATAPDVAVFKERLRVLTVGGMKTTLLVRVCAVL